jgi:F420-dependent methylenetetrahydromethanopterin dehydrogenase
MTTKELEIKVAELSSKIEQLEELIKNSSSPKPRDRGPDSTRDMNDDDARRVIFGDLASLKHKDAAKELGLSYGQIYSARGCYTFKNIHAELKKLNEEKEKN